MLMSQLCVAETVTRQCFVHRRKMIMERRSMWSCHGDDVTQKTFFPSYTPTGHCLISCYEVFLLGYCYSTQQHCQYWHSFVR